MTADPALANLHSQGGQDDDVMVTNPPHRSVCRYCCPAHDSLHAEVVYWRDACGADHVQRVKRIEAEVQEIKRELYKMPVHYEGAETIVEMVLYAQAEMAQRTLDLTECRAEVDSLRIENQNLQAYVRQMHLNGYPHPGKLCGMEHAAESGWTTPVPQPQEQRKP